MLGVPYERVFEGDSTKGPKRKSPWIEDGEVRLGDSELILSHVERGLGRRLDAGLSPAERARAHMLQRMLEEHYHQVFEYELLLRDEGFAELRKLWAPRIPPHVLEAMVPAKREAAKLHLFERGIARHTPAEVEAMGRADIDALTAWLGDRSWFITDAPTRADASAFGLLAASIRSPLPTPVCTYARRQSNLVAFVDRGFARFFPELDAGATGT
jgi:glutathione S-transferase